MTSSHITRIGVPTETKPDEFRVGLTPAGVRTLTDAGHEVLVQAGAGAGSRLADAAYEAAGAQLVADAAQVWAESELIVKVKEPQAEELGLLGPQHTLFAYLHLAPDLPQTQGLMKSGATAIAFETVVDDAGRLPLLTPMSQIAGRMAAQVGARLLELPTGGPGLLMGGVPGVDGARVLILGGGGVVGTHCARIAVGMGAQVTIVEANLARLTQLEDYFGSSVRTRPSNAYTIDELLPQTDLAIGSALVPGARTPNLVSREQLKLMTPGSVIVDVAVDQGGVFETSRPTTHRDPTYCEEGIIHYGVTNMPGAVPVTATQALANATLPYVLRLANEGHAAWQNDPKFAAGVNVLAGHVTSEAVARALSLEYVPWQRALPQSA